MRSLPRHTLGTLGFIGALGTFLLVTAPGVRAFAEKRVVIEHVEYSEEGDNKQLVIHADVLDIEGRPVEKLDEDDVEILASGAALEIQEIEITTAEKAGEPIAVVILMNASNGYHIQGEGEQHSTFQQEKEGVSQFIGRLSGNDKIAVVLYREGVPHEVIYPMASDFKQAKSIILDYRVPDADEMPEEIGGAKIRQRTLAPEVVRAIDKALGYMADAINDGKVDSARRRFVVLMTDGKDRETRKQQLTRKIDRVLEKYQDYKVRIHAIGFTADDPRYLSVPLQFANGTTGVFRKIESGDFSQIPASWEQIAGRIKKQRIIKITLAALPDHGEHIKGKDEANYNIELKVKASDGALIEGQFNDVRLPLRGFAWGNLFKWIGIVLGAILGIVLLIFVIKAIGNRGGGQQVIYQQQEYDGPDRGKLRCIDGPLAGQTFPLVDDVTTIGSMKGNTIVISDGSVSRRHAAIKIDQMRYEVADMNSTNGVLVNGARIHKVFLKDGDRIKIGNTEMDFQLK